MSLQSVILVPILVIALPGDTPRVVLAALSVYYPTMVATVLGLTLPGDTVLYLLLPLYASSFGVSLAEAGLLLAANRMVRIVGYGWVARSYERYGPRGACTAAAAAAAVAAAAVRRPSTSPPVWVRR